MEKSEIVIISILCFSYLMAGALYYMAPEMIISHWDLNGNPNGEMPKLIGSFIMPFVLTGMLVLFFAIPRIDPLKENIAKFRKDFNLFIAGIFLFMFFCFVLMFLWNIGIRFDFSRLMFLGVGIIFYLCGYLMSKSKRNWFIGIRTPWTMSSDAVWNKTHKLGGILFKLCGGAALVSIIFPRYAIWIILVPVLGSSIYLIAYSYWLYKKLKIKN